MSCNSGNNCVCDAVQAILDAQEAVEDQCPTSCFSNLLSPAVSPGRDTIPFILYTKKGKPFTAFGNLNPGLNSFQTPFFRVRALDGCCATLELLESNDEPDCNVDVAQLICNTEQLFRTQNCIEVDLDCFCAIQCLSPDLVANFMGQHKVKR
ncbi:CotY/CotZ family spore coat protein [Bacillus sp. DJP31]|uniref:CotY/CotZ family spore coat protein n=1 Tax=Bacillus sp. DJP31 TaxID=3409789 RepID=UPI003BB7C325